MKAKCSDLIAADLPDISRRSLLELAGLAIATSAFPSRAASALPTAGQSANQSKGLRAVGPIMDTLSTYMSDAAKHPLPDEVTEKAKHHVLDTLAAMVSGSNLLPGQRAIQFARAYGGKEVSTVVASNVSCGPIEAALANGVLAHADETDESHSWHRRDTVHSRRCTRL